MEVNKEEKDRSAAVDHGVEEPVQGVFEDTLAFDPPSADNPFKQLCDHISILRFNRAVSKPGSLAVIPRVLPPSSPRT
eukprot:5900949-Pleurochrysis_carterae.AAC.1